MVGPWAGVLLDRWRRRQVLLVGNLVRVAITLVLSGLLLTQGVGPAVFVLALAQRAESRSPYDDDADATPTMAADEKIHAEVVRGNVQVEFNRKDAGDDADAVDDEDEEEAP